MGDASGVRGVWYSPPLRMVVESIPSWKRAYTSPMSAVCFAVIVAHAATHARRARDLSVVAVPKVRDPIESAGAPARDGPGLGHNMIMSGSRWRT